MATKTVFKVVTDDYQDHIMRSDRAVTFEVGETYDRADLADNPAYHGWGFGCYPSLYSYGLLHGRSYDGDPPADVSAGRWGGPVWWGTRHTWRLLEVSISTDDVIVLGYPQSGPPVWQDLLGQFPNAQLGIGLLPGHLIVTRLTVVNEVDNWLDEIDWSTHPPGVQGLPL